MDSARTYRIYDLNTGQVVALLDADGTLHDAGRPQALAELRELFQRDLVVRERRLGYGAGDEAEGYEPLSETSMCYFGAITLSPGDPEYLPTLLHYLPSISPYAARAVED